MNPYLSNNSRSGIQDFGFDFALLLLATMRCAMAVLQGFISTFSST